MENDIFTEVDLPQNDDPDKDYTTELVGDDKKYKSVKDLAKGTYHANRHIQTLEQKLDELRKELDNRTTKDDFMTQIKEALKGGNTSEHQSTPAPVSTETDDSTLEQKLEALLSQRENKSRAETNINKINRVMKENFGDDAIVVINQKAKEMGLTPQALKDIAVQSPDAFFKLVGATEQVDRVSPPVSPRSHVNTSGQDHFSPVKNAKFYERMKQTDPKKYFDKKTTVDMIRDMEALGDRWYS